MLVLAAPVLLRPYYESRLFLHSAREGLAKGDVDGAITAYRSSISWRTPYNRFAAESSHELFILCRQESSASAVRLECLEQLKRGLFVSRSMWWFLPGAWNGIPIEQVENEMTLLAPTPSSIVREAHAPTVNFPVQVVAQLFFWSWIGMVFFTIWSEFDRTGTIKKSSRLPFAAKLLSCVTLFGGWLASLTWA